MSDSAKTECFICKTQDKDTVFFKIIYQNAEKTMCIHCMHPLLHGMNVEEFKKQLESQR